MVGSQIITESMAMDLLILEISLVPGTKLCPRCCSEIANILNNPKDYEDSKVLTTINSPINFPGSICNVHKPDVDQQDLDLELTQV